MACDTSLNATTRDTALSYTTLPNNTKHNFAIGTDRKNSTTNALNAQAHYEHTRALLAPYCVLLGLNQ